MSYGAAHAAALAYFAILIIGAAVLTVLIIRDGRRKK